MQFKLQQEVRVIVDHTKHAFKEGDIVVIQRIIPAFDPEDVMYICRLKNNERRVSALKATDFEAIV